MSSSSGLVEEGMNDALLFPQSKNLKGFPHEFMFDISQNLLPGSIDIGNGIIHLGKNDPASDALDDTLHEILNIFQLMLQSLDLFILRTAWFDSLSARFVILPVPVFQITAF